jgi:hypothetical protein
VVELTGPDRAKATTTIHEMVRAGTGEAETNFEQYGIYHDEVARLDLGWRFTRRLFVPLYANRGAVRGDVVTPRSTLTAFD